MTPGLVTHAVCIEECRRRGLSEEEESRKRRLLKYDFLAGEGLYKEHLSNTGSLLTWAIVRRGPQMWLIDKARQFVELIRTAASKSDPAPNWCYLKFRAKISIIHIEDIS